MCGIVGIISRAPISAHDAGLVARMNRLQVHRGPDGDGLFQSTHVAMGMRRLSIIDLETGGQPLYSEDRSIALVANGEIYNHVELRRELERHGHHFATGSDCETILHAYEQYGDSCVDHLRGMFAFAIWDNNRRRVLLARDRMGEKPLYLLRQADRIVFASELKALVGAGVAPFELDPVAITHYFHYGFVPEPLVAVRNVEKLPAASILAIDVDRWAFTERLYWRLEDAPPIESEPVSTIRQELERISEIVIRADVPVGISLSAGLDSSAVAALVARKAPGTIHAITVGYSGRPHQDERHEARALADHLAMPFHEIEVSAREMVDAFPRVVFDRDDPIGDISGMGYYSVFKRARELGIPVMLAGAGADELFWGYDWVRESVSKSERKRSLLNGGARVGIFDYARVRRPPYSYTGGIRWLSALGGLRDGWRQYWRDLRGRRDQLIFYEQTPHFAAASGSLQDVFDPTFFQRGASVSPYKLFTIDQPWPRTDIAVTKLICDTYLRENGLAQSDRLSMANSVELRLPLVDYRLVETVVGLRKHASDIGLAPKHWFREAVKHLVPAFVLRRRKRGFTPPWRSWTAALAHRYGRSLADGYLVEKGVLTAAGARKLMADLSPSRLGAPNFVAEFALVLETWCREMQSISQRTPCTAEHKL